MNSRTPNRSRSLSTIYSNSSLLKGCLGYLIGGLTTAFAFSGICLMSCDAKIRQQEIKVTQFEPENFAADLNNLNSLHGSKFFISVFVFEFFLFCNQMTNEYPPIQRENFDLPTFFAICQCYFPNCFRPFSLSGNLVYQIMTILCTCLFSPIFSRGNKCPFKQ